MDEPLLPYLSPRKSRPSPLFPLPEEDEVALPLTPSEFKDRLIFGPSSSSPSDSSPLLIDALTLTINSPKTSSSIDQDPLLQPQLQPWLVDPQSNWPKTNLHRSKTNLHRSKTAPAMAVINDFQHPSGPRPQFRSPSIRIIFLGGRMRIRMKVALALGVVVLCIGIGVGVMHFVEELDWLDSFYLSVMSVTTVGYGDRAFKSMPGRIFASIWLLVSTLAVARAFLYLAEARVDKRHRKMAKWVLGQDMTVAEFLAADIDNNGFVSKSEYVIYKLKELGKVSEKDISQICNKFDRLDSGNCGKITLADLMENHH
ncbi:unnamed protein product, partial [Vitis vinifera]